MTASGDRDDVDLLFARLQVVEPPADLAARILLRVRESEASRWPSWQQAAFACGYVGALIILAVLSFLTGTELEHSHLRDLLSLALQDISSVIASPGVYVAALREAIPWVHVAAVLVDIIVLAVATRLVLKVTQPRGSVAALRQA